MPTTRPRLSITLTPQIDRALEGFCSTIGVSKSSFIVQTLESALPQLERMAFLVQQLKSATPEAVSAVRGQLEGLEPLLEALRGSVDAPLDLFELPAGARGQAPQATDQGPPSPPSKSPRRSLKNPPAPNRGGSSPSPTPKKTPPPESKVVRLRDRKAPA